MVDNKTFIIDKYEKVKKLGFQKSHRKNNTGIGKTFEDLVGVVENNLDEPDLAGFEIKSHREEATSYVTLFTKSPTFPKQANAYLNSNYGEPYPNKPELKKLHTSMFANKYNSFCNKLSFKLLHDKKNEVIRIGVYDLNTKSLIDESVGYTYKDVEEILKRKLKNLFYVSADRKIINNEEYFHFNHAEIYTTPSLDNFLNLLDNGLIMYDIRIGSYASGNNYGKPHDHGSGFRILPQNIKQLYENKEEID